MQTWLEALKDLEIQVKRMFGCCCVCWDHQPVGWLQDGAFSLREVGLTYLPRDLKRQSQKDRVQEIPVPLENFRCEWLPRAVQDTAHRRREESRDEGQR